MNWLWGLGISLLLLNSSCGKQNNQIDIDVYGHAGISLHRDRAIYPANTIESILYAINFLDADGVEIDVQMTKDSILVLYHDKYLDESSNYSGCISEFNYSELENLRVDNSKYKIITLNTALIFLEKKQKKVYLDLKSYSYCADEVIDLNQFQYALNKSFNGIHESYKSSVILGSNSNSVLSQINYPVKCYETTDVDFGISSLEAHNYQCLLFFTKYIEEVDAEKLNSENINWGLIGVKDNWSIKNAVSLKPKYIITDNIAHTKKITK